MKLSLNKIYLGGISLLFILSLIFTSLAIYEEYRTFESQSVEMKKAYVLQKKKELKNIASKIEKIIKITPKYPEVLNTILDKEVFVKIDGKYDYIHSKKPLHPILYTLKSKDYTITVADSMDKINTLLKEKKGPHP
jgi:hypothetical protein